MHSTLLIAVLVACTFLFIAISGLMCWVVGWERTKKTRVAWTLAAIAVFPAICYFITPIWLGVIKLLYFGTGFLTIVAGAVIAFDNDDSVGTRVPAFASVGAMLFASGILLFG